MRKISEYLQIRRLYEKLKSPFIIEVVIIIFSSLIVFGFAQEHDAFEHLVELSREHEDWELDELFIVLMIVSLALLVIIFRHTQYLKNEIIRRREVEVEINKLAFYDSLTGLANRDLCNDRLEHTLAHAARLDSSVAVIFLDLDNFKEINDTFGHDYGDEMLKQVAYRLRAELRKEDTLARISGDEFFIILDSIHTPSSISILADRLLRQLAQPFSLKGQDAYIGLSIGIAMYPDDANCAKELVKVADIAMYHAKSEGKNTYRFFSSKLDQQAKNKLDIRTQLRRALENQEFSLVYQPVIDVASNRLKGAEALLRWNNKKLGMIPPDVFIPIAEETGLISDIGDWVLLQACKQNKTWQEAGFSAIVMSVNMSARQLGYDKYIDSVVECLRNSGLDAKYLELELTETTIMRDVDMAINRLDQLKSLGIKLAMDDFGTGYSSMSYLRKLKLNRLKIDRSFIRNIPYSKEDAITTKAIITLATNFNLKITAEGVETLEQLAFFQQTDCDSVQGYYFSRPVAPTEFKKFLLEPQFKRVRSD